MATFRPGVETIRLRRPDAVTTPKAAPRHQGLLQDKLKRSARAPWAPSLSLAFRMLVLLRFSAAMYSNIQDCDEVYNFWEPLHYLDKGYGFQTWETSPLYAIRSWAYVLLHLLPARLPVLVAGSSKRQAFFAVRIVLSFVSSYCEARFYRAIVDHMNDHLGRYMLFMMLFSSGMWNASTAFLPSTFSMFTTLLAMSFAVKPPSKADGRRTLGAVVSFAIGAAVGWPFALLLAVPYVLEELFVYGKDRVSPAVFVNWTIGRAMRLATCGIVAATVFIPVIAIDSWAYGKLAIVPWNIIEYNIFGGAGRGPDLYGTEPWYFYLLNLTLNFNIIFVLALLSLPALLITHTVDYRRLGALKHQKDESSPYTLMFVRLAPFYLWLAVLSLQPHKEERFMYPIYPLICFNAATTLYLVRGWLEIVYIKSTSVYAATQSSIFKTFTITVVVLSMILSSSRILALYQYYHAPLDTFFHLESRELPQLLKTTGLVPPPPARSSYDNHAYANDVVVDLAPIKQFNLRLCVGKEWYRFPSHYLVPAGIEVRFIKSGFDGLLPKPWKTSTGGQNEWWKREQTRVVPEGLNDLNKEEPSSYVDVSTCHYLVDLDFPHHPSSSSLEPRYAVDTKTWERVNCVPFLDAAHSPLLTRALYVPLESWTSKNEYGDYCLLRNIENVGRIEQGKWQKA